MLHLVLSVHPHATLGALGTPAHRTWCMGYTHGAVTLHYRCSSFAPCDAYVSMGSCIGQAYFQIFDILQLVVKSFVQSGSRSLVIVCDTFYVAYLCYFPSSQREKQRVSIVAIIILVVLWLFVFVSLFVAVGKKLQWLEFLYFFSYVKLAVTLIKYIPQVRVLQHHVLFWYEGDMVDEATILWV